MYIYQFYAFIILQHCSKRTDFKLSSVSTNSCYKLLIPQHKYKNTSLFSFQINKLKTFIFGCGNSCEQVSKEEHYREWVPSSFLQS